MEPLSQVVAPEDFSRLSLIKVDVEGYEEHVLRGLEPILEAGARPTIVIEVHVASSPNMKTYLDDMCARFGFLPQQLADLGGDRVTAAARSLQSMSTSLRVRRVPRRRKPHRCPRPVCRGVNPSSQDLRSDDTGGLVVCVYRCRNEVHVARLIDPFARRGWTVALWALDETPHDLRPFTVGQGPGERLPLLQQCINEAGGAAGWLVMADDDIEFVTGDGAASSLSRSEPALGSHSPPFGRAA